MILYIIEKEAGASRNVFTHIVVAAMKLLPIFVYEPGKIKQPLQLEHELIITSIFYMDVITHSYLKVDMF